MSDVDLIDPNNAIDYLIAVSSKHAEAKAQRVYLEQFRKTKKALLMNECEAGSEAARERYAYAHPSYQELLLGLREAVVQEETLKFKIIAAQLRVEVWRSKNANNRNQDRTMR